MDSARIAQLFRFRIIIKYITLETEHTYVIQCKRGMYTKPKVPRTNKAGTINRYVRRRVLYLLIYGYSCVSDSELAQVSTAAYAQRIKHCEFIKSESDTHRAIR